MRYLNSHRLIYYEQFILLFLALLPLFLSAQTEGKLEVFLAVKDGRLVVDTSTFTSNQLPYPTGSQTQLVNLLNKNFAHLDSLADAGAEQWCFPNSVCKPLDASFAEGYRYLTMTDGKGPAVAVGFDDNSMMEGYDLALQDFFELYIFDIMVENIWAQTPLSIQPDKLGPRNYAKLQFPFSIKPPINTSRFRIIWDGQDTLSKAKTQQTLKGLDGQLWFRDAIQDRAEHYFFLSKFQLNYFVADSTVSVTPNRLARIIVKTDQQKEVRRAMYQLLPTPLFKASTKLPLESLLMNTSAGGGMLSYQFNLLKHFNYQFKPLPKLQTDMLQLTQMQLGKMNYSLRAINTPNGLLDSIPVLDQAFFFDIFANKVKNDSPPDTSNVAPPPLQSNPDGVIGANDFATNPRTFDNNRLKELDKQKPNKERRNFLGFGIDHSFGDGSVTRLIYQRLMKNGSTFSLQGGYAFNEDGVKNGGFFASGNFFTDYLFFNSLKKKLSMQVTANSTLTANRVFAGTPTTVRRSGGKAKFQLEWFREIKGQQMSSSLSMNTQRVEQNDLNGVIKLGKTTISFLDIGTTYFFKQPGKQHDAILLIQPELRLGLTGLEQSGGGTEYLTSNITLNWTCTMAKGFGFKFAGYWQHGSDKAPVFEQPSLKTAMNRGFKEDDIISQNLLGAQLEYWFPFPRFGNKWSGFNKYLFENIRLATFADFTRFSSPADITGHFLWSPGLGIRFIRFPAQVNFDWAYGMAPDGFNIGKSRFSIGLTLNGPL